MSEGSNHSIGSSSPRASKQQKRSTDASPGNAAPAAAAAAAAAAGSGTSPADAVDVEMTELSPPTAVQNAAHVSLIPDFTSASFTYAEGSNIKYLLCGLCKLPLVKPIEHNPCRLPFCSACVQVSPAPACPECAVPIRLNKTASPTRTVQMQLDDLVVVCQDCKKEMPRGTFEAHWRDECPQLCPFSAPALAEDGGAVCSTRLPRSELNAHIDSCKFAPVECSAAQYGCVWQGQREALSSHASSCPHVACASDFKRLLGAQEAELRRMRVALETREAQLKSYKAAGGAYALGTIVDAEDTEKQWVRNTAALRSAGTHFGTPFLASVCSPLFMSFCCFLCVLVYSQLIARIIKVDLPKKMYRIHYEDWDASVTIQTNRLSNLCHPTERR
jgi:hypothetical protein